MGGWDRGQVDMPTSPQTHRPQGYTPPAQREQQWASRRHENKKLYASSRWCGEHGVRLQALERDCWLCQDCMKRGITTPLSRGKKAKDNNSVAHVDHITPHNGDPELFYDLDNLQSLCIECHSRKTATEDGGFGNVRRNATQQKNTPGGGLFS